MDDSNNKVFKPANSYGGLFSLGITIFFIIIVTFIWHDSKDMASIITMVILGIIATFAFVMALLFPLVRYEIKGDKLLLSAGPISSKINISDIKNVEIKNLKYHPTSVGWKIPGYGLFRIYYTDDGWIRMYAHRSHKNIMVIKTSKENFGITPKEPEVFIDTIKKKLNPEVKTKLKDFYFTE